jgi:hypothetical protein
MKGGAFQDKQQKKGGGGGGGAQQQQQQQQQQRPRGKGGRGGAKAQLDRLEKKLGWGGFDDKLPPEKVQGRSGAGGARRRASPRRPRSHAPGCFPSRPPTLRPLPCSATAAPGHGYPQRHV